MRHTPVLALLSVLVCASSSFADWFVRAPYVNVSGGPGGVSVQAPFVDVRVVRPVERIGSPVPPPPPVPQPPPPPRPVPEHIPTLEEFAATFHPAPGSYEVTILHSRTCCPVTICFTLPPGCPKVCLHKHQLDFEYPCQDVRIRCQIFGKVKVSYH